jgi:GNAT superfamily N-acetyltransferase
MVFSVRASRPADHRVLAALLAELLGREALSAELSAALNTNLLRLLSTPGSTLLVAEDDEGALVGMVSLWARWGLFDDAPSAYIDRLVVRRGFEETAVAPALLEQALGAAQALGCTRVEFCPSEASLLPLEALERFGFTPVAEGRYGLDVM